MSNVIDFLERMGQDAHLRFATGAELEQALIRSQIDPALRAAILGDDQQRLEALLGAPANVCCALQPAREDEEEIDDDEDEDDEDYDDDDEEEEDRLKASRSTRRAATAL